jgi:hypothetical protein
VKRATINGVNCEGVAKFTYCGTLISKDNNVEKEIQKQILAGNRTYSAAISLFKSRLFSTATKILLYKTLIRLVVSSRAHSRLYGEKEEEEEGEGEEKKYSSFLSVTSGICHKVDWNCNLLGYYAASSDN